jgi:dipeptidyl aminopeptidase
MEEQGQKIVGIESTHLLHSSSASLSAYYPPGYLDIVPNEAGFNHIAYFSPSSASEPVFLTSGEWEVEGGIEGIDMGRGIM